jgi:hypothetical protein
MLFQARRFATGGRERKGGIIPNLGAVCILLARCLAAIVARGLRGAERRWISHFAQGADTHTLAPRLAMAERVNADTLTFSAVPVTGMGTSASRFARMQRGMPPPAAPSSEAGVRLDWQSLRPCSVS